MSELTTQNVIDISSQNDVYDTASAETYYDNWDQELFDLVAANADVIIKSPWHQGAEMTLSAAILSGPEINRENVHLFVGEVYRILADQVTETEESQEEDIAEEPAENEAEKEDNASPEEVDDKSNTETEIPITKEDINADTAKDKSENEVDPTANLRPGTNQVESTSKPHDDRGAETAVVVPTERIQTEAQSPIPVVNKNEKIVNSATTASVSPSEISTSEPEAPIIESEITEGVVLEISPPDVGQELIAKTQSAKDQINKTEPISKVETQTTQPLPTFKISRVDSGLVALTEEMPTPASPRRITDQEIESSILPVEKAVTIAETINLRYEEIELAEDELVPVTFQDILDNNSPADLIENEYLQFHIEPTGAEAEVTYTFPETPILEAIENNLEVEETPLFQLSAEENYAVQTRITSPEQPAPVILSVEEIETSITQLTELMETSEPETTQATNEILDKIIEISLQLEANNSENNIVEPEPEVREELKELVIELFDAVGIDYSPHLTESLTDLMLKGNLVDEIQQLQSIDETNMTPQASGTHEIIKKLLVGLNTMNRAKAYAFAIGRSALTLYIAKLAT